MSEKIMTLFGEELFPETPKPAKPRAKKKQDNADSDTDANDEQDEDVTPVVETTPIAEEPVIIEPVVEKAPEPIVVVAPAPVVFPATTIVAEEPVTENQPVVEEAPYQDDWNGTKQYYSIGEVAELMEIKTSKVRFWCNEFKMKIRTTKKGDRLFTPEQVKELRAIYHLVNDRKFTLAGAREKLNSRKKIEVGSLDLKTSLLQLRTKLLNIKNKLN